MSPVIHTVGHSNRALEEFLAILAAYERTAARRAPRSPVVRDLFAS